ncbi:MAG: InlB B-repeat-containing protein, partial [Chitinophagaceae bacterium]|nr:InlB B-repeat-containing protein [Chitinophagaceae bacterium]
TPTVGTGAWSIVSGTGGAITTTSSPTSTFSGTAGTTYTLRWTISNSPCTASTDDIVITFNRNPTTATAGVDQTGAATCGLTTVTLAGNTPTVGTGAWSIVSGTGGTITTASSPISTFTGTAGSTYTLRWTISNSPCTASTDDVVITFNRNPTTANAGVDQTGAATRGLTTVTLAGNSPTVGTGAWSIVSGTGGTITTASSPTSTFSGTAGSTYTLRWTIANSPCTASTDDVVITFNRNPPTIISFTPASGAPGTLVTITGTDLNGLSAFTIGGVATIAVSNTGATLVGMVMPGASTGTVGVTTPGGSATSSGTFTIQNTSYPIVQQGNKLTASNDVLTPGKGWSVALSADGKTALVGGYYDNNGVGATWVYTRSGNTWAQQEKLIGTGAAVNAWQGFSVALSADGNTAIVGGVIDNSAWVFTRSGTTWTQQGNKLVASDRVGNAWFGKSVSLSADGNTAILGGYWDNSNTGAAWVFTRSGNTWTQEGTKLVGTGAVGAAGQGHSVSLSADGSVAAIGGAYDDSQKGATWIFTRSGSTWVHQKIVVPGVGAAKQGQSVALSADATTLIIGGVNATSNVSNAWVFTRSGSTWTQQGTTFAGSDAVGTAANGTSVTLTADGNTAMMGSVSDNNNTGAAWVFTRSGSTWAQQGNKLLGTGATGTSLYEGRSVSLSADGSTALVGADGDNTNQGAVWAYSTGVLYNGNGNTGGSVPTSALATIGSSITLATNTGTLVKTGYTFAGWNTLANGTGTAYQSGASITLNSSLPLYARWTPNDYTVTFNANGGTGSMSNQTIAYLASANLTANTLTRTGYTFSGWATTSGGAVAYTNGASYTMSAAANVTLYAKWCLNSSSTTNVAVFSTNPTYLWNGIVRNAPGTYTYNTTNAIGCDSVATLNLTVVDPILPVTGINLSGTASDKQVKLSYKALNEREMANYAIERSAEGTNFTQIGMQQPINGTQASTSYGFIDNQPFVGINYYRIQGNSLNGQLQYSNVIALKVGNMMPTVTVAPNPILHQILNLKLNQLVKGNYKMIITDVIGRTVYGKQLPYDGVGTYIKTNLPVSIKPGMYYVRLSGEGNDFMDKFIIQ